MSATKTEITCCLCSAPGKAAPAKDGGLRTPKGWKKVADGFRCRTCTAANYMSRSIRLRIIGPHESETREAKEMFQALTAASYEVAKLSNWYLQRLLAADVAQLAQCRREEKFPPCPEVEAYGEATAMFPNIAPRSVCQMLQSVRAYYSKERFVALAAMKKNARTYRWDGLPVPVHVQAWRLERIEDDKIVLRVQIGPGKSWTLNVYAKGENLARMRQLADGEAEPGAAMFVRRAREPRPGEATGQQRKRVWFLRVSAKVPKHNKREKKLGDKVLSLGYDAESLLYGSLDEGDDVFEYPAIELRKSIAKFRVLDRRRQVDNSFHREAWSKRKAARWAKDRTAACAQRVAKTDEELSLVASSLARWCLAHRVGEVMFDVTDRGWIDGFPYFVLRSRIANALENAGIALHISGSEKEEGEQDHDESRMAIARPGCETAGSA